ncbi:oleate hydratase, partial [Sanguibacter sp. 26GB23]|uniref:oleate hydratase n=1 Tax=Sanguibacter sp. 26GB23 TaxID=3156066 RepID=UPI0032B01A2E
MAEEQGHKIQYGTTVSDVDIDTNGETLSATAIKYRTTNGEETIQLGARDLIFVTTGSIVEDTAYG